MPLPPKLKERLALSRKLRKGYVSLPAPEPTKAAEMEMRRAILAMTQGALDQFKAEVMPLVRQYEEERAKHRILGDSAPIADTSLLGSLIVSISTGIRRLQTYWGTTAAEVKATTAARKHAQTVNASNRSQFGKELDKATGVDLLRIIETEGLEHAIDAAVVQNVGLMTSVPQTMFGRIEAAVLSNLTAGQAAPGKSLREEISRITGHAAKHAKFIARDQTAKLNSQITEFRAKSLGVAEYTWRTSEDERVRDSHRELNGKVFSYDDPPEVAPGRKCNPGEDYQCRCTAEPLLKLDRLLEAADS